MTQSSQIQIETREQLLAWLGEAAEIEHNLMCCYLYAMFSLKRSGEEDLAASELPAVTRWHGVLRGIALEEMTHLTLVSNLMSAIGGAPHFMRPNFPVSPGAYPADVVIELSRFCMETLDHFIYLERPEGASVHDGAGFTARRQYARGGPMGGRLMPYAADYPTVGELYRRIADAINRLSQRLGSNALFCGAPDLQIGPLDSQLPGLRVVHDQVSALAALDIIVQQGEGSWGHRDSHFERFSAIKREFTQCLEANPSFEPARPAARNPVMRRPPEPQGKVWIEDALSGRYVDLANAIYIQMLRMLLQVYRRPGRSAEQKRFLVQGAHQLMRAIAPVAERLSLLPASPSAPGVTAGMSFAVNRALAALPSGASEGQFIAERFAQLAAVAGALASNDPALRVASTTLRQLEAQAWALDWRHITPVVAAPIVRPHTADRVEAAPIGASQAAGLPTGEGIELAHGKAVSLSFDTKRCIHARFCVTGLPHVFLANTPGQWIHPDEASAERLAAVAQTCPSGAIQYVRHDGGQAEPAPDVNLIRVRENGPLAVHAAILLRREPVGYRATLCRCGQSRNKPYCDGAHAAAGFTATGEPGTLDTTMLAVRDGPLEIQPLKNGPLHVSGNLELCSGTGRAVLRTTETRLCRCGQSQNKPFCDGSHAGAGFVAE
jgi:CDGSH-type Zn-finger protein/uncharacterized Fe-S cluster protein YjdI